MEYHSLLIKKARIFAPQDQGIADLLILGGKIQALGSIDEGAFKTLAPEGCILNAEGLWALPGLIDGHNHMNGGGGEGGFRYRVPPAPLSSFIEAGVTTAVGLLGTDGFCRSLEELLGKARGLREEGLSTALFTGAYQFPGPTLTGTPGRDIMLIPEIIGCKIALSDHRSSHPTVDDLRRLVSEVRVSSLLAGKSGVVCVHMGDEPSGLQPLIDALEGTDIPKRHFWPTHVGRNKALLTQAARWTALGGHADLTADVNAFREVKTFIDEGGNLTRLTLTSDGTGSMPRFDRDGRLISMGVGSPKTLLLTLRRCLEQKLAAPETLIALATANPADLLGLSAKGRLKPGFDGDVLLTTPDLVPRHLTAGGRIMMKDGSLQVRGTYEN